jgi:hypothetical protein
MVTIRKNAKIQTISLLRAKTGKRRNFAKDGILHTFTVMAIEPKPQNPETLKSARTASLTAVCN